MRLSTIVLVAVLLAFLAATALASLRAMAGFEGPPMSLHGQVALALGVIFSLLLGVGLMALLFHSARSGHDDEAGSP